MGAPVIAFTKMLEPEPGPPVSFTPEPKSNTYATFVVESPSRAVEIESPLLAVSFSQARTAGISDARKSERVANERKPLESCIVPPAR
jgi:hypothetical protein